MKGISKNSFVSPDSQIHPSVVIGPFSLIEAGVEISQGCLIMNNVTIKKGTKIGENNVIHSNAVIGDLPQDLTFDKKISSGVSIGNHNTIRESVTIHRATKAGAATELGDNNYLMACSHLAHDCKVHNHVVIANNSLIAGHGEIFDYAFISGNSAVHQHARIGKLAMIGGLTRLNVDAPPFSLTYGFYPTFEGLNLVGLKRAGMSGDRIKKIKMFYQSYYSHIPRKAKEMLGERRGEFSEEEEMIYDFIVKSKRGVLKPKKIFQKK